MEHYILRCKHCQKEYIYCTYGNGPEYGTEAGCSQEYCAECQKAIDEALAKIPVKFKEHLEEIDGSDLIDVFKHIKEERNKEESSWPNTICYGLEPTDYDITEVYQHNGRRYEVKWYKDTPEDKHIFAVMEYDLINKKATGRAWKYSGADSYQKRRNFMKYMINAFKDVKARSIDPPTAMTMGFLNDMEWGVIIPNSKKDK